MTHKPDDHSRPMTEGDRMLATLAALANPHRLRLLALLRAGGPAHVSRLAREVGLSRPLTHLHLRKLEAAALVTCRRALSADGKALAIYAVATFELALTPASIAAAAATLTRTPTTEGA